MTDTMLTCIILNTGQFSTSVREDVPSELIDHLLPVIDADGGPIPGMDGWFLDVVLPLFGNPVTREGAIHNGAVWFEIKDGPGEEAVPVILAFAAWTPEISGWAWDEARTSCEVLREALEHDGIWHEPPAEPPPLPWLAVIMSPFLARLADAEAAVKFGPVGLGVAWALIP